MNAIHDYAEAQPQRNLRRENMMVLTKLLDADLEPRLDDDKLGTEPVKDLVEIQVDSREPSKVLKIGSSLSRKDRTDIEAFLRRNLDVFSWMHDDMVGIDPEIMSHRLNIDPIYKSKKQKRRPMNAERYSALKEDVDKLIKNEFIREVHYPDWISNSVLIKKPNWKW